MFVLNFKSITLNTQNPMPLLSLVQELFSQKNSECSERLPLSECDNTINAKILIEDALVDVEGLACSVKAELNQLLTEEYYYKFLNNYESIPSDIAIEIERKVTPRIVDNLKHLNISDFKKETLVRKCMRQILAEN
ncbi:MAG TPA: hypothetical protein PK784_14575 [Tenuifilaceae bacterium]|nr:hypothetical protein [Tenuifilaceae bacterium]